MAAMKQVSQVIRCPSFNAVSVRVAAILCVCLSYSHETHSNLAEAGLIESLIVSTTIPRSGDEEGEQVLFS